MSEITQSGSKIALEKYGVRLLPGPSDKSHLIAASVIWGPFVEGDYVTLALSSDTYVARGGGSVKATTSDILLPAGVYDFAIPTGVTHVALISTWSGAVGAVWKS